MGSQFRVWGLGGLLGFRVWGLGCAGWGLWFGFRVSGLGSGVWGLGFMAHLSPSQVWNGIQGVGMLGFRVLGI